MQRTEDSNKDSPAGGELDPRDGQMLAQMTAWLDGLSDANSAPRSYGRKAKSVINPVAELLGNMAKIVSLSSIIGVGALLSYLHSRGAPIPPIQLGDIPVLALPVTELTLFVASFQSAIAAMPLVVRRLNKKYMQGKSNFERIRAALCCYGSWLGLMILGPIIPLIPDKWANESVVSFLLLLPVAIHVVLILIFRSRPWFPGWRDVFWSSILLFPPWLLLSVTAMSIIADVQWISYVAAYLLLFIPPLFMLLPMILPSRPATQAVKGKTAPPWALPALAAFAALAFYPYDFGAFALKFFSIGGDIPISISIKEMPSGSSAAIARRMSGCLILATASDVFIRVGVARRVAMHPVHLQMNGCNSCNEADSYLRNRATEP